ncbi:PilX N-terminal domain-containing pilus assembly protein [Halomonas stenophila]|uniref:Type 4 fimbrial biogenesis protein PilX N-terminal domain-containing protein n=1 Tax=Halomonas stenophila TaxID=795312 RepID=A0A7W5EWC1_9GAMM|nr:PilX N-terminal domain-containing pilus assembly protein [Halomonas stenophila]MBB3231871.1 hypothetical protein [Halomonas stenophila]
MNRGFGDLKRQSGAALIVTLVLLVVALLLGVTGFQNARNEEAMAGNQRASNLAMMAAEYGASDFWHRVKGASIVPDALESGDTVDQYMEKILLALKGWAEGQDFVSSCVEVDISLSNACYRVNVSSPSDDLVSILVDGVVHSGDADADSDGTPDEVIARRQVSMGWGAMLGEALSPFNLTGVIADYDGINSQADVSGEEVDGYLNPAISVSSKAEAEKIVQDIIGDSKNINDFAVFVPETGQGCTGHDDCGPDTEGVYHAKDVVTGDPAEYEGNYDNCTTANNDLCNYKGGIASELGTPILYNPEQFHVFINALVRQQDDTSTADDNEASKWTNNVAQDFGAGVHFVTDKVAEDEYYGQDGFVVEDADDYGAPVYDPDNLQEDGQRLSRPLFEVGSGNFSGSGVLIVDGDVEFKGNPEFDGLIIVMGDYTIDGSGNEPFTGAIISAPYSKHYEYEAADGTWGDLNPQYDSTTGEFLHFETADGSKVYVGSDGGWTTEPGAADSPNELATMDMIEGEEVGGLVANRTFDPVGLDVSGGGNQDYNYSYDSLLTAFEYFNGESLLAWLVGQAQLDGSYEYGLATWSEKVVIDG